MALIAVGNPDVPEPSLMLHNSIVAPENRRDFPLVLKYLEDVV
jgi:hypothetical protein